LRTGRQRQQLVTESTSHVIRRRLEPRSCNCRFQRVSVFPSVAVPFQDHSLADPSVRIFAERNRLLRRILDADITACTLAHVPHCSVRLYATVMNYRAYFLRKAYCDIPPVKAIGFAELNPYSLACSCGQTRERI